MYDRGRERFLPRFFYLFLCYKIIFINVSLIVGNTTLYASTTPERFYGGGLHFS